jgi:hypothetical protein
MSACGVSSAVSRKQRGFVAICAALATATACGEGIPSSAVAVSEPCPTLEVAASATLVTRAGFPIVEPIAAGYDRRGRFVVADKSEKAFTIFGVSGSSTGRVGGVGDSPTKFLTLYGAGTLGDSLYGYDLNSKDIAVLSMTGALVRRHTLADSRIRVPRTIHAVDDSLILLVAYPKVQERQQPTLWILDRTLTTRTGFWNLAAYYDRLPNSVGAMSPAVADASHGVVLAGITGSDSLFAFDYHGNLIASGTMSTPHGRLVRSYADTIRMNGAAYSVDSQFVGAGLLRLERIVVTDSMHGVIQLSRIYADGLLRRDMNDSALVALVTIDRGTKRLIAGPALALTGTLVGRSDVIGEATLLRSRGRSFDSVDVVKLRPLSGVLTCK